jgi:hypothetical protein
MSDLNGRVLFNAEFGQDIGAAPYRKGQVFHSVFAAARPYLGPGLAFSFGRMPWAPRVPALIDWQHREWAGNG